MTDALSSVEETTISGDIVTTTTKTKTMNFDHSITTTTTVDRTDHADEDNHMTTISEMTTTPSDLDQKIIRQIEYYFSDANMVRDKFLKNEVLKDDGWITLALLTTFKRLQSLSTDYKTILSALKKSSSGLLQLDEIEDKIRRHPDRQLPNSQAEFELALRNRTVYVQGFPKTANVTLDKLLNFFEKYGSTDNIHMKRHSRTKEFDGSVFVVFPTEEKAQEFIENSKQTPVKYEDGSILECSLQDKTMEYDERENRANEKQAKRDRKQEELEKQTIEHLEKLNNENFTGALIHLAGMAADGTRELIKEKFNPFTKLPWIDFNRGDTEAWVRLNEANTAKDVLEKVLAAGNGKLVIGNTEVTSRVVEGEEEAKFWKEANEKRAAQRTRNHDRHGGGKRNGRKNRKPFRGDKRKRDHDQDNENELSTESKSPKKLRDESID